MFKLIKNADLYTPDAIGVRHLLVAGDRIAWIGKAYPDFADLPLEDVFDAEGRPVVPGFVDGHAHTTGGGGEAGYASRVPAPMLSMFVANGVTTVVGLLGTDDTTRDTAQLLAATRGLRAEGMSAFCYTGGYRVPPVTFTGDVRKDIVNLDPVIAVGELAISDHRSSQPTLDELMRVASDAHVAGLMTGKAGIVHLHLGDGERGLSMVRDALEKSELPARVFNPTHCNRNDPLFDEALALSELGCTIDLTAFPVAEGEPGMTASDGLQRYLEKGLAPDRITISSDGGGCLPVFDEQGEILSADTASPASLLVALRALIDAGLSLEQSLPAFTKNPATLLRLSGKGSLTVGSDADLIVLDQNYKADSVMARGQWHRRGGDTLKRGTFEK